MFGELRSTDKLQLKGVHGTRGCTMLLVWYKRLQVTTSERKARCVAAAKERRTAFCRLAEHV